MIDNTEIISSAFEIETLMQLNADRVLLIDAGGVLFNNVIEESAFIESIASEFWVDASSLRNLYMRGDNRIETNRICVRTFLESCLMMLGAKALDIKALKTIDRIYIASVRPDKQIFSVLRRLRSAGRRLVLANNEGERWEQLKQQCFGHLDLFDTIASSWKLQAYKPRREYFRRLNDVLHPIPKERWWLVDDNADVVATARANGIAASRYSRYPG